MAAAGGSRLVPTPTGRVPCLRIVTAFPQYSPNLFPAGDAPSPVQNLGGGVFHGVGQNGVSDGPGVSDLGCEAVAEALFEGP